MLSRTGAAFPIVTLVPPLDDSLCTTASGPHVAPLSVDVLDTRSTKP